MVAKAIACHACVVMADSFERPACRPKWFAPAVSLRGVGGGLQYVAQLFCTELAGLVVSVD